MPHWLHTLLRVLVPGIIILTESLLFYVFAFQPRPDLSDVWSFMVTDWGKSTGFAGLSLAVGWVYYFLGVTHAVDNITFRGMMDVRENIQRRLIEPFQTDEVLSKKLRQLEWRTIRRDFYSLIDETPSLKTSVNQALLSGLGFYSFIDLGTISTFVSLVTLVFLVTGVGTMQLWCYFVGLLVFITISFFGARAAIKKHKDRSNLQLDALLSEHHEKLRDQLAHSVDS